jgi:hypothetical protein
MAFHGRVERLLALAYACLDPHIKNRSPSDQVYG